MEFMPGQDITAAKKQSILIGLELAVSHLKLPLLGMKGQHSCHRVGLTLLISQALSHQKHATAFGVDRLLPNPLAQALETVFALAQISGMQFGESSRQDQALSFSRWWFVCEWLPRQNRHC
jgi:hypothetical protein